MWGEYVGCHSGLSQSKYYYNWLPAFPRIMATIATGNMMTGLLKEVRKLREGQESCGWYKKRPPRNSLDQVAGKTLHVRRKWNICV